MGELPSVAATAMGLLVPLAYLSRASLAHINLRHPEITDFDLTVMPFVLKHGLIVRELNKPSIYLASHEGTYCPKRMGLAMKVAQPDREVYVQTFHRVHYRQTRAWLKRCEIIKTHD